MVVGQKVAGAYGVSTRTSIIRRARLTGQRNSFSRATALVTCSRLVLTPTGSGSWEHIGEKTPLPEPVELQEGVFEVGRDNMCDIRIRVPTVSSRHALLRVEDDKLYATDLNSTNGTLVNGQELAPMENVEISVGAEIIFGDMYLARFQLDKLPEPEHPRTSEQSTVTGPQEQP